MTDAPHSHTAIHQAQHLGALPSNQKFGWFFSAVFLLVATWFFWISSLVLATIFAVACAAFLTLTLIFPSALQPLNRLWYRLGLLLGKIISPIVLGLIFLVLITPVSLFTRLFGRDELKLRRGTASSYWVDRDPPGPASDSFKNQY